MVGLTGVSGSRLLFGRARCCSPTAQHMTTTEQGQPQAQAAAWRLPGPPQGLQSLKASLGTSQTAIVPPAALTKVSSHLSEHAEVVRKNSQLLLTSATQKAQTALKEAGLSDDWALLKRVGTTTDRRVAAGPAMRRVASDTNFQRSHGRLLLQRPPAATTMVPGGSPTAQQQLSSEQQRAADAWNWLSALNNSLSHARAGQQSKFALSRAGLEEQVRRDGGGGAGCSLQGWPRVSLGCGQGVGWRSPRPLSFRFVPTALSACLLLSRISCQALGARHPTPSLQARQLVHSASSMTLAEVKDQLLAKPKQAAAAAAATLENCQANLASLQTSLSQSLQQSLAEGRQQLERQLATLGEPGSPSSSASRLAALLSPQRLGSLAAAGNGMLQPVGTEDQAAAASDSPPADALGPWSLLAAPLRGREAAAIEALATESEQEEEDKGEPSSSGRGWGPFQVRRHISCCTAGAWRLLSCCPRGCNRRQPTCCALVPARACSHACFSPLMLPCSGKRGSGEPARRRRHAAACGKTAAKC